MVVFIAIIAFLFPIMIPSPHKVEQTPSTFGETHPPQLHDVAQV
jgi:hypothetical protein